MLTLRLTGRGRKSGKASAAMGRAATCRGRGMQEPAVRFIYLYRSQLIVHARCVQIGYYRWPVLEPGRPSVSSQSFTILDDEHTSISDSQSRRLKRLRWAFSPSPCHHIDQRMEKRY